MDHTQTDVRVIIVDDEDIQIHLVYHQIDHLWPQRNNCQLFTDSSSALAFIRTHGRTFNPDIFITDFDTGKGKPNGFELMVAMHMVNPCTRTIMITGNNFREKVISQATERYGLVAFMNKPFKPTDLRFIICKSLMKK